MLYIKLFNECTNVLMFASRQLQLTEAIRSLNSAYKIGFELSWGGGLSTGANSYLKYLLMQHLEHMKYIVAAENHVALHL